MASIVFFEMLGVFFPLAHNWHMTRKKEGKRKGRQVFTLGKAGPNSGKAHGLGLFTLTPKT